MIFEELRKKHHKFTYQDFKSQLVGSDLKIVFRFSIDPDIEFAPEIIFPNVSQQRLDKLGSKVLDNLVFNLGLMEMISYWKATCSPEIEIKAGIINADQIVWWKDLLIKGLGEFFYQNKIDFTKDDLVEFMCHSERSEESQDFKNNFYKNQLADRNLILIGGGKDSVVTLETFKTSNKEFNCLILNPTVAAKKISEIGGCQNPIIVSRTIDPKLLDLNKQGYLNGHTPFSAYLAFLSTLAAHLYDYKNIVVSNESSSDEGNIEWMGKIVNHQYSKTTEFEKLFKDYSQKYLSKSSNYFSFLRPLTELEIAKRFAPMEKYHQAFRSCNRGSKTGVWCCECSKCLFSFLILYPFLGSKTKDIFGEDLLNKKSLKSIMEELMQVPGKFKPFDCVGTKEEVMEAIKLGIKKSEEEKTRIPLLLTRFSNVILGSIATPESSEVRSWTSQDDKILVLGLGAEGLSVLKYLQQKYPNKKIAVADKNEFSNLPENVDQKFFGPDYLKHLEEFRVIIKSPGVSHLPEIKQAKENGKLITSSTKIFFEKCPCKIIGVTGTKGKSTTSSLIYEVLKADGIDVFLAGNIGNPALDILDQLNKDSVVVYELSSFQLSDLEKSPHIAVFTNIFEEHIDYHGDFENYKNSKFNITKFQKENDYFIYNQDIPELKEFAEKTNAKKIPYSKDDIENFESNLIGGFNQINVIPSIIIGRMFKVSDDLIHQTIKNFKSLPHRLEFVTEKEDIKFYNDSLATNPRATIAAIESFGEKLETLITGGFDRGIDYSSMGPAIAKSKIKTLILFPDTGEKIWKAVCQAIPKDEDRPVKYDAKSMEEAVKIAFDETDFGKICLMSPASASFNMFKDYKDRGEQFKNSVLNF